MVSCLMCTRLLVAHACAGSVLGAQVWPTSPSRSLLQQSRNLVVVEQEEQGHPRDGVESLRASADLADTFRLLTKQLPEGATRELFERFKVCTACTKFERFGETHDGGYLTCMDGLAGSELHAAYSMGVEKHDKWSEDVYNRFKIPVHQFDCTVAGPAQRCGGCHFHKVCIEGARGGGSHSLRPKMNMEQVLNTTGMGSAPDDSLVMKMDIEGAEWPIFAEGFSGLSKFTQLIVEFHRLQNAARHSQFVQALRNIENAGFKVAHFHGNNCCGMYNLGGFAIPRVLEVTFLKNGPTLAACAAEQQVHPLDSKNVPKRDLPLAHLPA